MIPHGAPPRAMAFRVLPWLVLFGTLAACGGGATSPTPPAPPPPPPPPAAPSLRVEVVGFGNARDADGFTLTVAGTGQPLAWNGGVTVSPLPAGTTLVSLGGIAPHCRADTAFTRRDLAAGRVDTVRFTVGCFGDVAFSAFAGSNLHVYYMDTVGAVRRLTTAPGRQEGVQWSPDGSRLLYLTSESRSNPTAATIYDYEIATIRPDGSPPRFLGAGTLGARNARWSPDGRQITYNRYPFNTATALLQLVDTNGANIRQPLLPDQTDLGPDWILGGTRLAFGCSRAPRAQGLCVAEPTGAGLASLDSTVTVSQPVVASPDGQWVAFETNVIGQQAIRLASAVTPGPSRALIPGIVTYGLPAWAPDNSRLAVNTFEGGNYSVRVVRTDGTGAGPSLVSFFSDVGTPSWSADGAWIMISALTAGGQFLYVLAADGSRTPQQLGMPTAFGAFNPQWRPGSRFVRRP